MEVEGEVEVEVEVEAEVEVEVEVDVDVETDLIARCYRVRLSTHASEMVVKTM